MVKLFTPQWRGYFPEAPPERAHLIAAEIARKIPEMARDSTINNETVIYNMIKEAR